MSLAVIDVYCGNYAKYINTGAGIAVSITRDYRLDDRGSILSRVKRNFSTPVSSQSLRPTQPPKYGQNAESFSVKAGDTYSYQCALEWCAVLQGMSVCSRAVSVCKRKENKTSFVNELNAKVSQFVRRCG
jgi:hypothetical protein